MHKYLNAILIVVFLFVNIANVEAQRQRRKSKTKNQSERNVNPTPQQNNQAEPASFVNNFDKSRDIAEVEAKGTGVNREDALQDALRNAIGQAIGVSMSSQTQVENFVVIRDAISSRTEGYISSYQIVREVPFPDRHEITVRAKVTVSPMQADFNLLARAVGGVRFLVMYDDRNVATDKQHKYEFAVERINEFLSQRGYRYIDKKRFDALKAEARGIMHDIKATEETFIQHLGLKADAQFIIYIKNIHLTSRTEAFDTRTSSKVIIEAKAYDNCTGEGLGTIILESNFKSGREAESQGLNNITEAITNDFSKLLSTFTKYIGSWANNGAPFELRFYHTGGFRELRALRTKLQTDPDFGGEMEIVSLPNYTKLNVTFKNRPDQLADKILDYSDAIPELAAKKLDVKFIYGRQINFAPSNVSTEQLNIQTPNTKETNETPKNQTKSRQ